MSSSRQAGAAGSGVIDTDASTAPHHRSAHSDEDNRIVDAALSIIVESGVEGLSVTAVSDRCGIPEAQIHRRVGGRRELRAAAHETFLANLEASWESLSTALDEVGEMATMADVVILSLDAIIETNRTAFRAFMLSSLDDEHRARNVASIRRFADFVTEELGRKFGTSPAGAHAVFRVLIAEAALGAMYSADELAPRPHDPDAWRRHRTSILIDLLSDRRSTAG